jgi:cysteinyl-tRNA synthetase
MSMKYLGETFDIHGGGADLIFPHHENEIAQSECATGKPFGRYWVHNGFVNIHAEKMSKSIGNVLAVRDLLEHVTPGALKIFLLGTHYRAPLDFSEEAIGSAGRAEQRLLNTLSEIRQLQEVEPAIANTSQCDRSLLHQIRQAESEFTDAMDDDLNTPRALAAMFALIRDINVSLRDAERGSDISTIDSLELAGDSVRSLGSVLGILLEDWREKKVFSDTRLVTGAQVRVSDYVEARKAIDDAVQSGEPLPEDKVRIIVERRRQCRDEKDWAGADSIRAWLADHGVIVEDTPRGARWHLKSSRP